MIKKIIKIIQSIKNKKQKDSLFLSVYYGRDYKLFNLLARGN